MQFLRRGIYVIIVAVWLILMILPIIAFMLAARGEINVGSEPNAGVRLFLINSKDQQGVGIERRGELSQQRGCFDISLNYFLWEGKSGDLNTSYCQCYDTETGFVDTDRHCFTSEVYP